MIEALELVLVLSTLANMVVFAVLRWQWGQLKRSDEFNPNSFALKALEKFRERIYQEQRTKYLESKQNVTDVLEWMFANQRHTLQSNLSAQLAAGNIGAGYAAEQMKAFNAAHELSNMSADNLQWSCLYCGKPKNSCKCSR